MTAPNDVATLVEPVGYLKPSSHWTQHPEYVAASAWNDHPWMQGVFTIPVFGERSVAALQAEVERAKEDERDRLLLATHVEMMQHIKAGAHYGVISAREKWLRKEGAMLPDARSASRKEASP